MALPEQRAGPPSGRAVPPPPTDSPGWDRRSRGQWSTRPPRRPPGPLPGAARRRPAATVRVGTAARRQLRRPPQAGYLVERAGRPAADPGGRTAAARTDPLGAGHALRPAPRPAERPEAQRGAGLAGGEGRPPRPAAQAADRAVVPGHQPGQRRAGAGPVPAARRAPPGRSSSASGTPRAASAWPASASAARPA